MPQRIIKDPDAVLPYKFDWAALTNGTGTSDWLTSGETIDEQTTTVDDAGLTIDSSTITDTSTSVTVWLSGGTVGTRYGVTNRIVTSAGKTEDRTISVYVVER